MNNEPKLPNGLEKKHRAMLSKMAAMADDWKNYEDEIIPEDSAFAKEILDFLIELMTYAMNNYQTLDMEQWSWFLNTYEYNFFYGPHGDDNSYLSFDEANLTDIFLEIGAKDAVLTKETLGKLLKKFTEARKKFP